MKIAIQSKFGFGYTAGPKAVNDATSILMREGWTTYYVNKIRCDYPKIPAFFGALADILHLFLLFCKLKKKTEVFIQWPIFSNYLSVKILLIILKLRKTSYRVLIHDIQNLRLELSVHDTVFEQYVKGSDYVIVHSPNMEKYLRSLGIETKTCILTSFDYLTTDVIPSRTRSNIVTYVGNLAKSEFLQNIDNSVLHGWDLYCYGLGGDKITKCITYMGCFVPENVSVIEGSWGLVWDGTSVDTCDGVMGRYLRYNAPHKLSLYIVSGLPLIVWQESSLVEYVTKNKLGVTIKSLGDISDVISSISDDEYIEYCVNVKNEAERLKRGEHLINCINGNNNI